MPALLVEKLLQEQGEEKTRRMLEAFLQTKPVTIRLKEDLSASEKERLISAIEKTGCKMSAHPYLPYAYCIEGAEGLLALPGFEEGLFQVQFVNVPGSGRVTGSLISAQHREARAFMQHRS